MCFSQSPVLLSDHHWSCDRNMSLVKYICVHIVDVRMYNPVACWNTSPLASWIIKYGFSIVILSPENPEIWTFTNRIKLPCFNMQCPDNLSSRLRQCLRVDWMGRLQRTHPSVWGSCLFNQRRGSHTAADWPCPRREGRYLYATMIATPHTHFSAAFSDCTFVQSVTTHSPVIQMCIIHQRVFITARSGLRSPPGSSQVMGLDIWISLLFQRVISKQLSILEGWWWWLDINRGNGPVGCCLSVVHDGRSAID